MYSLLQVMKITLKKNHRNFELFEKKAYLKIKCAFKNIPLEQK